MITLLRMNPSSLCPKNMCRCVPAPTGGLRCLNILLSPAAFHPSNFSFVYFSVHDLFVMKLFRDLKQQWRPHFSKSQPKLQPGPYVTGQMAAISVTLVFVGEVGCVLESVDL